MKRTESMGRDAYSDVWSDRLSSIFSATEVCYVENGSSFWLRL